MEFPTIDNHSRRQTAAVCLTLAAMALAAFWRGLNCDFILLDDPSYVSANPNIQGGLTLSTIKWAFTTGYASNWHPLTWLSHALDVQLFGLKPRGHHAVSLGLHAANTVVLFLALRRLTAAFWLSAVVAGLFAVHPLHAESVIWVAERKDVLSTLFFLLAIWAYAVRCQRQAAGRPGAGAFYGAALVCAALALMAKPMAVTLPFVFLLLDYWPLNRAQDLSSRTILRLVWEKTPFFLMAAASSAATYLIQQDAGIMANFETVSLASRLDNVPVAFTRYVFKILVPVNLGVFYPHPAYWPAWKFLTAVLFLGAVTWLVCRDARHRPYAVVGWLWFLGMLVPVLGLVQVGNQAMADRYAYLPGIGIFIAAVWWLKEVLTARQQALLAGVVLMAYGGLAWRQAGFWKDNLTLMVHTAEISSDSYVAFYNLGLYWQHKGGDAQKAIEYYEKCLQARPGYAPAHNNLGYILLQQGKIGDAIGHFEASLRDRPNYPEAIFNLGRAYLDSGEPAKALSCFQTAVAAEPNVAAIHFQLGRALAQLGKLDQARVSFEDALALFPQFPKGEYNLADVLARQGRNAQAIAHFQTARADAVRQNDQALVNTIDAQLDQLRSSHVK